MKKILLIDDEKDLRSIFKIFLLGIKNIEFFEAGDGKEGIEMARSYNPDLIIMDYRMPIMNGLEATKEIRSSLTSEKVPIIMYTGYAKELDMQEAIIAGCNEVVYKPINTKDWMQIIYKYIGIE
ncbi:MAG: response regulator [Candidatus Margulisbacteria bacterium]|nr:response regulator [Candidatus Margulisiibacteriota bacterium]